MCLLAEDHLAYLMFERKLDKKSMFGYLNMKKHMFGFSWQASKELSENNEQGVHHDILIYFKIFFW